MPGTSRRFGLLARLSDGRFYLFACDLLVTVITDRFCALAGIPWMGRSREEDFGQGCRSFAVGEYVIVYCVDNEDVLILRVVHGRRQLDNLFGQ